MKALRFCAFGLASALALVNAAAEQPPKQPGRSTAQPPSKPRVFVTISKETTYITGPLRKDGYVNYVAALNERCQKGVTPENNAAVLFWQAMGPGEIQPRTRARYFRMLGMQQPPDTGDYFISFDKFVKRLKDAKDPRISEPKGGWQDPGWEQLTQAMQRPWSKQELPILADWIAANERPLVLLLKASKRAHWYAPMLGGYSGEGTLSAVSSEASHHAREVGRALAARAMLRLNDGNLDDAWNDLLACHRLARLVAQGATLIDGVDAIAIDGTACAGDQAILPSDALSAARIAKMRYDFGRLRRIPKMVDRIDIAERFQFLDIVACSARDAGGCTALLGVNCKPESMTCSIFDEVVRVATDWDLILRMGNSWYDRIVAACRQPVWGEERREVLRIENEVKSLSAHAEDPMAFGVSLFTYGPREAISRRLGNALAGLFLPGFFPALDIEKRGMMRFEVTRLGLALAAYHTEHGSYPDQLSEVVPHYFAKVPTDMFANDGPLHYKRQGKGYLLYSVGLNGRDDGGRRQDDAKNGEDWDDLSVRVP